MGHDAKVANGANNHLLVSIAQDFGVNIDKFGTSANSAFTTGPLSGLA
jgi:hypothetical protein